MLTAKNLWFYIRTAGFIYVGIRALYFYSLEGKIIDLAVGVIFTGLAVYDLISLVKPRKEA